MPGPRVARWSRSQAAVMVAALGAVAGCAGPLAPLEVDVHAVGSDITLGAHNAAVAALPLPPSILPLAPGHPTFPPPVLTPTTLPPGVHRPTVTPSGPCPDAPALQIPAIEAGVDIPKPPRPATYHYRTAGTWKVGSNSSSYPKDVTETVGNVAWDPSTARAFFEFDVTTKVGVDTTVVRYRVVPSNGLPSQQFPPVQPGQVIGSPPPQPPTQPPTPAPQETVPAVANLPYVGVGDPAQPGVYLVSVTSGTSAAATYNGDSGMLLATLPLTEGNGFQSSATAGSRTVEYTSIVGKHARVNACGSYLDSWTIRLQGTVTQSDTTEGPSVDIDDSYALAPQFGGLFLQTHEKTTSSANNTVVVSREVTSTINSTPKAAA